MSTRVDYLVGGLRISISPDSMTPGPRSHITNFVGALRGEGCEVGTLLASDIPPLGRFSRIKEGAAGDRSRLAVLASDLVRIAAGVWTGLTVSRLSFRSAPEMIYERAAVMQSMASWHLKKSGAVRVVESNGLMSIETAADRGALVLTPIARALERHVYRRADVVVAVSSALKDAIVAFSSVNPEKVLVVPNAMPASALKVALKESTEPTIGFAGAIVPWQQLDRLLESLATMRDQPWRLEVVGAGPSATALIDQSRALGIADRIDWLGKLTQEETYSRMAGWAVGYSGHKATHGAEMYHSPLKLYEYASFGLECVCTSSADAHALDASGLSVHYFDTQESLTSALRAALNVSVSRERRNALRERLAADHDWNARARSVLAACGFTSVKVDPGSRLPAPATR